ncbi:MAG TPA: carboxypeptidase regulatory-like domain-containing protein, partial [bacterium]|nr:carboxypeptidase regulatory-like domain-containing protein [bacterium]
MRNSLLIFLISLFVGVSGVMAQSAGKIAGQVVDAENEEPLPGVNVIVEGTDLGAATGSSGQYTILNVPPGSYDVSASIIGYATVTKTGVDVNIGLTTREDFQMQVQAIAGQEVVVEASRPIVQADVSGSERNIDPVELTSSPYKAMEDVLAAQVGFTAIGTYDDQPQIRGDSWETMNFIVDGVAQRDPLSNRPHMKVNLDAVQEVKVQTGGFNAEYGNIQSGLITVVTKEGGDRYSGSVDMKYSPPALRQFGPHMYNFDSPLVIPFVDEDAGAFTGNDFFDGWNDEAAALDPSHPHYDKPMELYARYLWRHRSLDAIDELKRLKDEGLADIEWGQDGEPEPFHTQGVLPDFTGNATLGGPVPFLPFIKFFGSYRQEQVEYWNAFADQRAYEDRQFRGKLTSNLTSNIKVQFSYFNSMQVGGYGGTPGMFGLISRNPYSQTNAENKYWYPNCGTPLRQTRDNFSLRMTHTLSSNTFYNLQVNHRRTEYEHPRDHRNTAPLETAWGTMYSSSQTAVDEGRIGTTADADALADAGELGWENWRDWAMISIGGQWYDEAPAGFGPVNWRDITGEYRMESCVLPINDTYTRLWEMSGDITSQVNPSNEVKAGFEIRRSFLHQYYAQVDPSVNAGDLENIDDVAPLDGALYIQDKLEYGSMIANIGVRADWMYTAEYPVVLEEPVDDETSGPYSQWLLPGNTEQIYDQMETKRISHFKVSPRLGISHPISTVAKIFFNYGHFYQWPDMYTQYRAVKDVSAGYRIDEFGNPAVQPPRTIAYEIGYEHNLFNRMSLNITGYYRDINNRIDEAEYHFLAGGNYDIPINMEFSDVRGFESQLELRRGSIPYFSGWASLDYRVSSNGEFGFDDFFEDPTRQPDEVSAEVSNPDVRPLFKMSLDFYTPDQMGPNFGGFRPVGGLNMSLLYTWQRGEAFTWNPNNYPLVEDNVRWRPYQRWDFRLRKSLFQAGSVSAS